MSHHRRFYRDNRCPFELRDWSANGAEDGSRRYGGRRACLCCGSRCLAGGEAMLTEDEINAEMTAFQERRQAEAEASECIGK